jgi:hypothetical protein
MPTPKAAMLAPAIRPAGPSLPGPSQARQAGLHLELGIVGGRRQQFQAPRRWRGLDPAGPELGQIDLVGDEGQPVIGINRIAKGQFQRRVIGGKQEYENAC